MKQYGIVYHGTYSHIVAIKSESEAEEHAVSEYFSTLAEAKSVLKDYLKDEIESYRLCLAQVQNLREEDF